MQNLKKFDHVINEFWSDPEHFVSFYECESFWWKQVNKERRSGYPI